MESKDLQPVETKDIRIAVNKSWSWTGAGLRGTLGYDWRVIKMDGISFVAAARRFSRRSALYGGLIGAMISSGVNKKKDRIIADLYPFAKDKSGKIHSRKIIAQIYMDIDQTDDSITVN